jgi:O-antigen biosynthesis protein
LRARQVWDFFQKTSQRQLRLAIKIGAPNAQVRNEWGDFHFAQSLKYELDKLGHTARVDCIDNWYGHQSAGDDVVLVLRGLTAYKPRSHQLNLMWNISHPDTVSDSEYSEYDHVFVASAAHTDELAGRLRVEVSCLLQCTDPRRFRPDLPTLSHNIGPLFVGNSRGVRRLIVDDAISLNVNLSVFGSRWEGFIPERFIKGSYIRNEELGSYYRAADVVLNDHWDNMRAAGFISNRVFDVAATGALLITDAVEGISELFGPAILVYKDRSELSYMLTNIESLKADTALLRESLAARVMRDHTFEARALRIMEVVAGKLDHYGSKVCNLEPALES